MKEKRVREFIDIGIRTLNIGGWIKASQPSILQARQGQDNELAVLWLTHLLLLGSSTK